MAATSTVASAEPTGPPGFTDGTWTGTMVWVASIQYPDVYGSGNAGGDFEVTFAGGTPAGAFTFSGAGFGSTPDAKANLTLSGSGSVAGSAEQPVLLGESMSVSGVVNVPEYGDFPVDLTLGAAEMDPLELDVRHAGCEFVSGDFQAQIAQLDATVSSTGGSLSVPQAFWSAVRTGSAGATTPEQLVLINQMVTDGVALGLKIDDGTFDAAGLQNLLEQAATFAAGIERNAACGIGNAAHFSSVVAGVVTELLLKMIGKADLFTAEQFQSAVVAGIAAGVLGANSGEEGTKITQQLLDVLLVKLTEAIADNDIDALFAVAFAAGALGDSELAKEALAAAGTS